MRCRAYNVRVVEKIIKCIRTYVDECSEAMIRIPHRCIIGEDLEAYADISTRRQLTVAKHLIYHVRAIRHFMLLKKKITLLHKRKMHSVNSL